MDMVWLKGIPGLIPLYPGIAAAAVVVAIVIWRLIVGTLFRRRLRELGEDLAKAPSFSVRYSLAQLKRRSRAIEKSARKHGTGIVSTAGIDLIWIESLKQRKRRKDFRRVLHYASDQGLYQCFLTAMEKPSLAHDLVTWLESTGDFLYMRKMAGAGVGEPFDGELALELFHEKLSEIREMTGDPEWPSRYFAVKLLVHDADERSSRAVWDAFSDSHPLVRRTAVTEFQPQEKDRLKEILFGFFLDDPSLEVRKSAHERLNTEFPGQYDLNMDELSEEQTLHVLELLRTDAKEDQDIALRFLDDKNLELRRAAAEYLSRCGRLKSLCMEVDFNDLRRVQKNLRLLQKASEVNITSFLECIEETKKAAPLLICAEVLLTNGDRSRIASLGRKVFSQFSGQRELMKLYETTVRCVAGRGTEEAMSLLDRELLRWSSYREMMELLLPLIPERAEAQFSNRLLSFLDNSSFPAKDVLRLNLKRLMSPEILEHVLEIIRSDRSAYIHDVRIEAVKLLGELELPYCLQTVLENLFILPAEQAKAFAEVLSHYPARIFKQKVKNLLKGPDAKVRAALIAALPATNDRDFLKQIRDAVKDADPDVRIASVWALAEFRDFRSVNRAESLLRDPVDRVRTSIARALGNFGSKDTLKQLQALLLDQNEVEIVKAAAIEGLGNSTADEAVDILVQKLEAPEELEDHLITALSEKPAAKKLKRLVENFKDASAVVRDSIVHVFIRIKEQGEPALEELLKEDIPSLKPFITEILEKTGFVEDRIRRLSDRDPLIRRESAGFLSLLGSAAAFRGLVMAARDPDEDVRVQVVKALERLETKKGREILKALENDPERRIRKYTAWAMERLRAKEL